MGYCVPGGSGLKKLIVLLVAVGLLGNSTSAFAKSKTAQKHKSGKAGKGGKRGHKGNKKRSA
jgi:hypothetical protein